MQLLAVCLGGALGTGARYLVSTWAARAFGEAYPYGTLAVNLVGCFLMAAILHAGLARGVISPALRVTLTAGVMGGLTTYSSFNQETFRFLQRGMYLQGASYFAATVLGCMLAAALGLALATAALGPAER